MLDRLKQVLVKSFVGTIALGYLLAQVILYFTNIFADLGAGWTFKRIFGGMESFPATAAALRLQAEAPIRDAFDGILLLLIWLLLFRWLYFAPAAREIPSAQPTPE